MEITLGQQYNVGEKPTAILCTLTLISMQGHQKKHNNCLKKNLLFLTFTALVANPKKLLLHSGQSRSWSAEQGGKKCSTPSNMVVIIYYVGYKYKATTWYLTVFPNGSNLGSTLFS